MLSALLRIILYFTPFIREVFIQSNEDKRLWLGRAMVIFLVACGGAYLYSSHMTGKLDALERENGFLREKNHGLVAGAAKFEERIAILDRQLMEKQRNLDNLDANYKALSRRAEKIREENKSLTAEVSRLKHSLSKPAEPKNDVVQDDVIPMIKNNEDRLKGLDE